MKNLISEPLDLRSHGRNETQEYPVVNAGKYTLVVSTNENYAFPAAVAIRSALINAVKHPSELDVIVFYYGDNGRELSRLQASFSESNVHIQPMSAAAFLALPAKQYFGNDAVYSRISIGRLLDESIKRAVYIDADTITLGDISELWEMPLCGNPLGAALEMHGPVMSHRGGLQNWREAGLPPQAKYFNSGVLSIDLNMWREENIEEQCFSFIKKYEDTVRFPDQDALNAVMVDRWTEFDQSMNTSSFWDSPRYGVKEHGDVLSRTRLFHYQGPSKPWHADYGSMERRAKFIEFAKMTAWSNNLREFANIY